MQFVQVLCSFCAATNGLITPFIGQLQRKHSIFIKRYFKIVYIKRVRKVLCFRCFRCSCTLIGLYLLCTPRTPHRAFSSFFLNKGKGIGSPRPLSGAEGSTSPHLPRRPMGESFWGERQRRWGDDNAPQGGPGAQPRHAFGDFRRETKVTRGLGRSARSLRAWELCSHIGECRGGASPLAYRGSEGAAPPRKKTSCLLPQNIV